MQDRPRTRPELEFAAAIFLGALLLFQVQPLISRFILPWFGGGPAVWTVCMLFFQALLFVGYSYAFVVTRLFSLKTQLLLHTVVIVLALFQLPIAPDEGWKPVGQQAPTQTILLVLLASIGTPYFLLATTSPLVQVWYASVRSSSSPYRLYALSNFGSLLALLSYPFLVEPKFSSLQQSTIWSSLFVVFVVLYLLSAVRAVRKGSNHVSQDEHRRDKQMPNSEGAKSTPPSMLTIALWFALSMTGSVMLLAITNALSIDVAVVPFLWILPLTLYLLTFIICFGSALLSTRIVWSIAWILCLTFAMPLFVTRLTGSTVLVNQLILYLTTLFAGCMVCHGELVRLKPEAKYLTTFYLTMAAGGAGGGVFSALIAPVVFPMNLELSLAIVGTSALMMVVFFLDKQWYFYRGRPIWAWIILLAGFTVLSAVMVHDFVDTIRKSHYISRNFYGVLRIKPKRSNSGEEHWIYELLNGRTIHGGQFASLERLNWPTTYYGEDTAIGTVLRQFRQGEPRRIGIVGLGVGTICAYAEEGDACRFYEINPAVIRVSETNFSYLEMCRGDVKVIEGDARISLENEPDNEFDVLVLDAFSSDAIPVHLVTREAFETYLRHLKPDGILAAHVSNRHLDLRPVLAAHADWFDLEMLTVKTEEDTVLGLYATSWTVLSRSPSSLDIEGLQAAKLPQVERMIHWTDDRNSLFQIMKFNKK